MNITLSTTQVHIIQLYYFTCKIVPRMFDLIHQYGCLVIKIHKTLVIVLIYIAHFMLLLCILCMYTVFQKKTSTHIIGYKLRNSCLILIIFDTKIPHII